MKSLLLAGAVVLVGAGAAWAEEEAKEADPAAEFKTACEAYQAENGGSSDCGCLAQKVVADEGLAAEIAKVNSPETLEAAPENVKMAIADCTPKEDEEA